VYYAQLHACCSDYSFETRLTRGWNQEFSNIHAILKANVWYKSHLNMFHWILNWRIQGGLKSTLQAILYFCLALHFFLQIHTKLILND
jgi:hypothetical protein